MFRSPIRVTISRSICQKERELTSTGETADSETSLGDGEKLGAEGGGCLGSCFGDIVNKVPGNGDWGYFIL